MGHGGPRYFLSGIVYYTLSPFVLKPKVASVHGVLNMIRRIKDEAGYVCTPLLVAYLTYRNCEYLHEKYKRKQPGDYANDK
ncbi:uncharacterized protein LOC126745422 [Anthonomus grandis grandis]|uniref:uncharacterized protein LOC126745422 n=1 Tax=Anthonomus grandis grandis TaxID=2921223 RepID=UPI002166992B|nr:uncharacterized protein LOC126745422 [Anthonomus grandis grandis]